MSKMALVLILGMAAAGCNAGRSAKPNPTIDYDGGTIGGDPTGPSNQGSCAVNPKACYTVFAHSDHVLYRIDLQQKNLVEVGPFNAPMVTSSTGKSGEDVITDLAVSPAGVIYVISHTSLYTADATNGHVTMVGPVTDCGSLAVALSFTPDGKLYAGDFKGAFCNVDITANPPVVSQIGTIGSGLALSGDLVAVGDGTMYGTAYKIGDSATKGTQIDNLLIKINPATGQSMQMLGQTGYPKLFGVAYALGQVFGFTHDGSGDVVTIDPATGKGTLFNSFMDPTTGMGIAFAGAGVNSMVSPTIM